ncbi:hypothetical protein QQF64_018875 [Cirrhinus molitorella]|uniref:DDE Tnp4 domain-containing protein n=1 Tax=Cirrhinus molitorella TaxID=172907 RepID=A0ABR3LHA4_9TELE
MNVAGGSGTTLHIFLRERGSGTESCGSGRERDRILRERAGAGLKNPSRAGLYLTPYLHPDQAPHLNYNRAHKITRAIDERVIGQLKRRFHVLHGEVRLAPGKVCRVITACAVLHNICKERQIADPPSCNQADEADDEENPPQGRDLSQSGIPYRAQFTNLHFR